MLAQAKVNDLSQDGFCNEMTVNQIPKMTRIIFHHSLRTSWASLTWTPPAPVTSQEIFQELKRFGEPVPALLTEWLSSFILTAET